ncbi:helix-turn-helix domain-containing protein [Kribbella sp. NBC_01245]|uniref:helix-turn-helix domain-containing protein n=1 Tax=Kribbella sp. NBC_01245 TaxID=2903578 RepID=UPI002E2A6629|nr:MerR family transcriptional regulator [Kribbella sp. NBC_01245]
MAGTEELWTLDQLTELVGTALAVDYPGQVNGRVRAVPDRRAIRWYSTIGLVDRPAEMRGRTALYGRRHLLQLVAIKRLQSQGRALAEIQAELAGATDRTLSTIAALPTAPSAAAGLPTPTPRPATAPAPAREREREPELESAAQPLRAQAAELAPERARFWTDRPTVADADGTALVTAIRLSDGVTVVLDTTDVPPTHLTAEQLSALRAAAAPLLAELARQLLTHSDGQSPTSSAGPSRSSVPSHGTSGRSTAQRESGDTT